jgi:hypothetical protein
VCKFYPVLTPLLPWHLHGGSGTALPLLHSISYWKLYYCFHKEFILSHLNPVYSLTLCFLMIDIYIAISITKSAKYLHFTLRFSDHGVYIYHSRCPTHLIVLDLVTLATLAKGTNYEEAIHCAVFFHIVIFSGSDVLSALFITPSAD